MADQIANAIERRHNKADKAEHSGVREELRKEGGQTMTIDIDIMSANDCNGNEVSHIPMVSWTLSDKDRLSPEQMNDIKRDLERMLTERLNVA